MQPDACVSDQKRSLDTMGRLIDAALRKSVLVCVHVSPEELQIIDAHATSVGLARSPYLRKAGLKQNLRTRAEEEIARELIRIGVLLQQTPASQRASEEMLKRISRALDKLSLA